MRNRHKLHGCRLKIRRATFAYLPVRSLYRATRVLPHNSEVKKVGSALSCTSHWAEPQNRQITTVKGRWLSNKRESMLPWLWIKMESVASGGVILQVT